MVLGANGFAVSQSTGDVQVTRTIGNGSLPAQYQKGDNFVVTLDYHVTPTQYVVSFVEHLPDGWVITNSSVPFEKHSSNNYTCNISSPLTGVADGKIFYVVHIDDNAPNGDYQIDGGSGWFSSYADVKSGEPTDTTQSPSTDISVVDQEANGPCIWISNLTEISGDGDGHLEAGETARFNYDIWDHDGINSNYVISLNGNSISTYTEDSNTGDHIAGTATVTLPVNADPNNVMDTLSIQASDPTSAGNSFSLPIYVPNYDYTAWMSGDWNGFTAQTAAFEPSSAPDGGWTYLNGGNPIKVPTINVYYKEPKINREASGSLSGIPFLNLLGYGDISGTASATLNATPHDVSLPYTTYPIYSEYSGNAVSATFRGNSQMLDKKFHVILVNLSAVSGKLDLTNVSSIVDGLKGMTPEDIKNAEMGSTDKVADIGSCDFNVDSSDFPELGHLGQGYYALLVLDYNVPNTPCLVSAAPIIVTKNGLSTTQWGPMPMPGSNVNLSEELLGDANSQYVYMAMMVPENEYSADVTISGDGSLSGTTFSLDGLSLKEDINVVSDGTQDGTTVTIHGRSGDQQFTKDDLKDTTKLKDFLTAEAEKSNLSYQISQATSQPTQDLILKTTDTMPTGNYILTSIVLDRNTGNIAAINQTTIMLGATYDIPLYTGWNLISLPIKPTDDNLTSIFTPDILKHVFVIWEYNCSNASPWNYYVTDLDNYYQGNLTNINYTMGYWVRCYNNTTLHITGTVPESSNINIIKAKYGGWNLVGNPTFDTRNVVDVYGDCRVVWKYDNSKWVFDQQSPWDYWTSDLVDYYQGNLTELKPGYGYWVQKV